MNLRATQSLLWRAITWPTGVRAFLAQSDPDTRRRFAETFAQSPAFASIDRVQVYAEAYFWRLYEVVLDQFPVTAWLAGAARFHDLVTDFVLAHPSQTPDIRRFAAPLPAFVRTHRLATSIPGLADVATIDWAIGDAVDRADEPRLTTATVQALPPRQWPSARFELTATATIVECALPYSKMRKAWAADEPTPTPPPVPSAGVVLVWRQANHEVYQRSLQPAEARALRSLAAGGTFADACDAAAGPETRDASATDVARWLGRWLEDELLISIR